MSATGIRAENRQNEYSNTRILEYSNTLEDNKKWNLRNRKSRE